jgi:hypothetical protein
MKVISLLQPWASLVVLGHKKIETRSWNTKYRGELLIHASLPRKHAIDLAIQPFFYECLGGLRGVYDLPVGAIIGKVNLKYTAKTDNVVEWDSKSVAMVGDEEITLIHLSKQELAFGDYSPGRYGWLLSDPVQFAKPIPCKGSLSIWDLSKELEHLFVTMPL